jgi:hypothetical protein
VLGPDRLVRDVVGEPLASLFQDTGRRHGHHAPCGAGRAPRTRRPGSAPVASPFT